MRGKVLIVEDFADWRELLSGILSREGHDVAAVSTIQDAQAYLDECLDLDLAILDIRLVEPEETNEDGMRLLAEIRQRQSFTRVIMVPGHGTMETQRRAFREFQAFDFFRKEQFDSEEFRVGVREADKDYIRGRRYDMWQRRQDD
jgi:two-component system nitrogen regulation response regulator NtrX